MEWILTIVIYTHIIGYTSGDIATSVVIPKPFPTEISCMESGKRALTSFEGDIRIACIPVPKGKVN